MDVQSTFLSGPTVVRLLNALAGVAGGIATPAGAHALVALAGQPAAEERLIRWAVNVSGLAWAGASAVDLLLVLRDAATITPALADSTTPAQAQIALWNRLRREATQ
jgi:hypothetical protein